MYKTLVTILILSVAYFGNSQNIGINSTGTIPLASAMLDVSATDKGLLIPRVDIVDLATALPVAAPTVSLLVYNTNVISGIGYYFWDGAKWTQLSDANSNPDNDWYEVGGTSSPDNINDDIFTNGNVGIGVNSPGVDLAVWNTVSPSIHIRRDASNEWYLTVTPTGGDRLGFRAGGNAITDEKLSILTSGNVGVGTITPLNALHVSGGAAPIRAERNGVDSWYWGINATRMNFTNVTTGIAPITFERSGLVGVLNPTPTEALDIVGSIKIVDGTEGVNKVLTSDATGKATWETPSGGYRQVYQLPATNVIYPNNVTTVMGFPTITAPYTGFYLLNFKSFFKIPTTAHHSYYISVYINGVLYSTTETYATVSANSYMNVTDVYTLNANAGEVIQLRVRPASGGADFEVVNTLAHRVKFDLLYLGR